MFLTFYGVEKSQCDRSKRSINGEYLIELNPFGPNLFTFDWDFIDSDNFEGQRSKVLKYPSDYLIQPLW